MVKKMEENRRVTSIYATPRLKFTAVEKSMFCKVARDAG